MRKICDHFWGGEVYSTMYSVARLYSIKYADHVVGVKEKENPQYKILASKSAEGKWPWKPQENWEDNINMVPCKTDW